jgi:hypothetical protein
MKLPDCYHTGGIGSFTIGQSQKWVNMTLKYIFTLGENRLPGFEQVYPFAHIPVDNIILEQLYTKELTVIFTSAWSRLDEYSADLQFQQWVRTHCGDEYPLDFEFYLWMGNDNLDE